MRFYSTVDLVNALEQEKAQGKADRIAASLQRIDLVVLDELGYLPFSQAGGALLFHLLSKLRREDDHPSSGPAHPPLSHPGEGNESHRFLHSTKQAKKRIKAREQSRKGGKNEAAAEPF